MFVQLYCFNPRKFKGCGCKRNKPRKWSARPFMHHSTSDLHAHIHSSMAVLSAKPQPSGLRDPLCRAFRTPRTPDITPTTNANQPRGSRSAQTSNFILPKLVGFRLLGSTLARLHFRIGMPCQRCRRRRVPRSRRRPNRGLGSNEEERILLVLVFWQRTVWRGRFWLCHSPSSSHSLSCSRL